MLVLTSYKCIILKSCFSGQCHDRLQPTQQSSLVHGFPGQAQLGQEERCTFRPPTMLCPDLVRGTHVHTSVYELA